MKVGFISTDYRSAGRVVSVVRPSKLGTHWDQWPSETVLMRFLIFVASSGVSEKDILTMRLERTWEILVVDRYSFKTYA